MLSALGFDKVRSLSEKINNKGMIKFVNTNVSHFGLCSFMFCSTGNLKIKVNFVSSQIGHSNSILFIFPYSFEKIKQGAILCQLAAVCLLS